MIGPAIIIAAIAALVFYWPALSVAFAPELGGGGGGGPLPSPSSDTPSTPPTLAPALDANTQAIVALVLELAGDQDPAMILGIIQQESGFVAGAINTGDPGGGAWGLMQMLASTAAQFGVADPRALLDPRTAITAGVRYLDWITAYLASHGVASVTNVVAAWNEGVGNVVKGLPDPAYVGAVTSYMQQWRGWLDTAAAVA